MITMRKSTHGFPFLSHDKYGAPPELRYKKVYGEVKQKEEL